MRRCQRQVFFANIAAWHNARDPLRRESFLLSHLKSTDAWRGSLVHQAIQKSVVPCWQSRKPVPWEQVVAETRKLGARQIEFSRQRQFRESGMSKTKHKDEYCALYGHEFDPPPASVDLESVLDAVEKSLWNLSKLEDFLKHVEGRNYYRAEVAIASEYNGVRIQGVMDLIFGGAYGHYGVVDWKDYSASTTDARLQMSLYAWLMCKAKGWPVSSPENIELWEVNLGLPTVQKYLINQESFDELEDFMYRSTERLRLLCGDGSYRAADLENYEYTENPNSCRFCPYQKICREPEPWITTELTCTKSKGQRAKDLITGSSKLLDWNAATSVTLT
jgi:CRISPR/Cas system-associated exonuclease Cas4 (RecB family)